MEKIIKEAMEDIEEYGDEHEENCACLREEECDCDMHGMKQLLKKYIEKAYLAGIRCSSTINTHLAFERSGR